MENQKKHQSQKNSPNRNPGHGLKAGKPKPIIAQEQSILIHDQRGTESPQAPLTQDVTAMPTQFSAFKDNEYASSKKSKPNRTFVTLPLKPAGTINSKFIDQNVHASIERMSRYEQHAKALQLIMSEKRRNHSSDKTAMAKSFVVTKDVPTYNELQELRMSREQTTINNHIRKSIEIDNQNQVLLDRLLSIKHKKSALSRDACKPLPHKHFGHNQHIPKKYEARRIDLEN